MYSYAHEIAYSRQRSHEGETSTEGGDGDVSSYARSSVSSITNDVVPTYDQKGTFVSFGRKKRPKQKRSNVIPPPIDEGSLDHPNIVIAIPSTPPRNNKPQYQIRESQSAIRVKSIGSGDMVHEQYSKQSHSGTHSTTDNTSATPPLTPCGSPDRSNALGKDFILSQSNVDSPTQSFNPHQYPSPINQQNKQMYMNGIDELDSQLYTNDTSMRSIAFGAHVNQKLNSCSRRTKIFVGVVVVAILLVCIAAIMAAALTSSGDKQSSIGDDIDAAILYENDIGSKQGDIVPYVSDTIAEDFDKSKEDTVQEMSSPGNSSIISNVGVGSTLESNEEVVAATANDTESEDESQVENDESTKTSSTTTVMNEAEEDGQPQAGVDPDDGLDEGGKLPPPESQAEESTDAEYPASSVNDQDFDRTPSPSVLKEHLFDVSKWDQQLAKPPTSRPTTRYPTSRPSSKLPTSRPSTRKPTPIPSSKPPTRQPTAVASNSDVAYITSSDDTSIFRNRPDKSYDINSYLSVKGGERASSFIKFDLSVIRDKSVAHAHLQVYSVDGEGGGLNIQVSLLPGAGQWSGADVTYDNPVTSAQSVPVGSFYTNGYTERVEGSPRLHKIDVTRAFRGLNLGKDVTLKLYSTDDTTAIVNMASSNWDDGLLEPELVMRLANGDTSFAPLPTYDPTYRYVTVTSCFIMLCPNIHD